jgi:hypothetical protein
LVFSGAFAVFFGACMILLGVFAWGVRYWMVVGALRYAIVFATLTILTTPPWVPTPPQGGVGMTIERL